MSEYICPRCRGGFIEPANLEDTYGKNARGCPWCNQEFGEYSVKEPTDIIEESLTKMQNLMDEEGEVDVSDFKKDDPIW